MVIDSGKVSALFSAKNNGWIDDLGQPRISHPQFNSRASGARRSRSGIRREVPDPTRSGGVTVAIRRIVIASDGSIVSDGDFVSDCQSVPDAWEIGDN